MRNQGIWVKDPSGQDQFISYQDLEDDVLQSFTKPVGGFVFPAQLFLRAKLGEVPFYLQGWLPKRGKALIYGSAKAGKSYLAIGLSRCLGAGEPFLGIPTKQATVLYIQFELGEEILQERMLSTNKQYDNVFVGTTFSMKIDTEGGAKQLLRAVNEVRPSVLIFDPWYKAILGDENENKDIRRVVDYLDSEIIEPFECSIVIIHHAGKDTTKRGRGSSVLEDWVDSYIQMQKISKKDEPLRVKLNPIFLRHAPLPPEPIEAELGKDFEFRVVNPGPTVKQQVERAVLESKEPVSPAQLFQSKIGANTSVYKALKELVAEGKIIREKQGVYHG